MSDKGLKSAAKDAGSWIAFVAGVVLVSYGHPVGGFILVVIGALV